MFRGFMDPDRGPVEPVPPENFPYGDGDDSEDQKTDRPSDSIVQAIHPFKG
jgi:hypothetical protein